VAKKESKTTSVVRVGGKVALLSEARRQLAIAECIPDIKKLADYAEAVRYAAKAAGVSVAGVNDWTHFKIDCQRKGWAKIELLREAGKLAERGRPKNLRTAEVFQLSDLIEKRAYQHLANWHRLALLGDAELAELVARATAREQLIAERALIKLGAAKLTDQKRRVSRAAKPLPDGMELRIGDCRKVLADVPDNSAPLVLTDPAYGDDAEALYQWLAEWSARVLIPGGSLICFTGQSRLNRDMKIFDEHLRYWWTLAMFHVQPQRFPGKFVMIGWKPVLWFVKNHRRGRSLVSDVLRDRGRDKEAHDWGQGEAGVTQLIEDLTDPGELIVDPFAGTCLWGRIAASMGRRWLGADVERGGTTMVVAHGEAATEPTAFADVEDQYDMSRSEGILRAL
jgi:hypothetical protein